jgi:hypothetical protein
MKTFWPKFTDNTYLVKFKSVNYDIAYIV